MLNTKLTSAPASVVDRNSDRTLASSAMTMMGTLLNFFSPSAVSGATGKVHKVAESIALSLHKFG